MKLKDILKNFKYLNPIYWINRKKYKKIYNILIDAKHFYTEAIIHKEYVGICACLLKAFKCQNIHIGMESIKKYIPEFNRTFCNANNIIDAYWWEPNDIESRIKAFNKLIICYINKMD